jgi:RimJ/RimL family protein N-acetyltransferase
VFDVRRERRVTALIEASNAASLRVAARLEMTYEADTDFYGTPIGRYVLAMR